MYGDDAVTSHRVSMPVLESLPVAANACPEGRELVALGSAAVGLADPDDVPAVLARTLPPEELTPNLDMEFSKSAVLLLLPAAGRPELDACVLASSVSLAALAYIEIYGIYPRREVCWSRRASNRAASIDLSESWLTHSSTFFVDPTSMCL